MRSKDYSQMAAMEAHHWWFVSRRRFILNLLRRYIHPLRFRHIVDIGAGTGGMEPFFAQFGPVTAIEPNAFARGLAKRHGVTLRSGRAERTGLKKESTTLVALCDVLYHKGVDDRRALAESYRLLSRGGYLLITDCAMPFLTGPHDREFDARERYTLSGLAEKVGKAGLDVVYGSYTFYLLFPVVMAIRMFSRLWFRRTKRSDVVPMDDGVNRLLVRINAWEAAGIGRVKYPYGSSLILLAKKR